MSNKILESVDLMFEAEESLEDKLRSIIDIYYEDKMNEDGDCFAGTEDSYAEEMLLQRIEELSTEENPLPTDEIYGAISLADSEEQAIEKALEAANGDLKESEFDAADIADSWNDFMKWIEEDPNRCDAANHCSETGNIEDADFDSKEFRDLFREYKESQLDEDQQLSKLDLMAGEVITQLEQIKKADSSVKIDRPYIEQYMNTAYGASSALDDKDVGYILGRVLKHYNLAEAEGDGAPIGGSNFNPGTRRKGDEEDRKKMVQRDAGEIDPERREKAIARIKKYWPRVPKSWLNSRTDEYLEQTADHYEAMEARKLAAKQKQASAS